MHECPECGKRMATAGGLEIHEQIAHKATPEVAQAYEAGPADDLMSSAPPLASVPRAERDPRAVVPMERPRSASKRAAEPFIALAIVALLVAGVASALTRRNTTPATPLAIVQASASATTGTHTTNISLSIAGGSGPLKSLTEQGGFDFDSKRFRVQVDLAQFGLSGAGKVDAIADFANGLIEYIHLPAQLADEAGGKPWIKVDLQAVFKKLGIDANLGAVMQGGSSDPTQGLGMVRGAENVVKVGTDDVRGVATTHYHLDVNFQKAIDQSPPGARAALQQLVSYYTVPSRPADVWIDSDGRMRRMQQKLDFSTVHFPPALAAQANQFGSPTVTVEYYGFGNPVDIKLPPPDQVTDASDLGR
jgi:hypothetical protein